jgi:hypothetical protein
MLQETVDPYSQLLSSGIASYGALRHVPLQPMTRPLLEKKEDQNICCVQNLNAEVGLLAAACFLGANFHNSPSVRHASSCSPCIGLFYLKPCVYIEYPTSPTNRIR